MRHRNADGVVAVGNRAAGQTVALGAEDDGQLFFRHKRFIIHAHGVVTQRHGGGAEAQLTQPVHSRLRPVRGGFSDVCPWNLKNRSHADTDGAAVERITAGGGKEDRVHIQRGGRTDDRADIGGIHHVLQNGDASGVSNDLAEIGKRLAAHGAQNAACKRKAGQLRQNVQRGGENGDISAALDDFLCLPFDVLALHQKRDGLIARIQSALNDLWAFGNEQRVLRIGAAKQLVFRQTGIDIQLRSGKIGNFYDIRHRVLR